MKCKLSEGEDIITYKAGSSVAGLIVVPAKKKKRQPGHWTDKMTIEKDFDTLPRDFIKKFSQ